MLIVTTPYRFVNGCIASAVFALAGMTAQIAVAAPIYSADTLLSAQFLSNSGKEEVAMLRDYAGDQLLTPTKSEEQFAAMSDGGQWYIDVGMATPGFFVLKFGTGKTGRESHYFFKNDGAVGTNKLVWTNEQVNFLSGGGNCFDASVSGKNAPDQTSCNIGRLSHYAFAGMLPVPPVVIPPVTTPPVGNPPTTVPPTDVPESDLPPADVPPTDIPEPGSLALAGLGLLALLGARKKRAK